MRIDYDEESRWPEFRWLVTGIKWYPAHATFGKKPLAIRYGWFGSLDSAILWCSKQNVPYSFPSNKGSFFRLLGKTTTKEKNGSGNE